jgi:hypothetical protein
MMPARRVFLSAFAFHLCGSLLLGYLVLPSFTAMREPPRPPPSFAPLLVGVTRLFFFPLVSLANLMLVTPLEQPGLGFIVANSALISALAAGLYALVTKRRHSVA